MDELVDAVMRRVDLSILKGRAVIIAGTTGLIGGLMWQVCKEAGAKVHVASRQFLRDPDPMAFGHFDYVIHAAGYGQPSRFTKMPTDTVMVNTMGMRVLAQCLDKSGTYLFLSSSEVYDPRMVQPMEDAPLGGIQSDHPRACYVYGKLAGEVLCHSLRGDLFDYHPKIARVALAYGPGVKYDDTRVLSDFIRSSIETGEIVLRDSGMALRTYCYITDTVEMLFNIMLRGRSTIYNVAGVGVQRIFDVATLVGKMTGAAVKVPHSDMTNCAAPAHVEINVQKYQKEFGRPDFVPFHVGLEKTIEWFKSQKHASQP